MLLGILILGVVGPFVIGSIAEWLIPDVGAQFPARSRTGGHRDDLDDQKFWYGFANDKTPFDWTGLSFNLDFDRACANAKLANRPVLVYFTTIHDVNARKFDRDVMRTPSVIARLRQFVRVAAFVDSVPHEDEMTAERLRTRNEQIQEDWLIEVTTPALGIVDPKIEDSGDLNRRKQATIAYWYDIKDEVTAVEFLDRALESWSASNRP